MASETLRFDLLAKDNASKVFDKVGDSASNTESKFSKVGGGLLTFGKVAAAGLAAGGAAAVIGGKHFLDLATNVEAMGMKAKTVFGDQAGTVDAWAAKNAAAMGLTGTQATGLAANFADLLIPMGFTRKAATGMSTDVVGLSGALSQWSGGTVTTAGAADVLAKAMLGERDGLKALGISISDADVKAQLLKDGTSKLTGAALQQATATATQTLIMQKSTDAQAAYAAGGSPLLSSQAQLKAAFGELQQKLSTGLMPVFSAVLGGVTSLVAAFRSGGIGAAVASIGEKISSALPIIRAKLAEWGQAFWAWVQPMIPPLLLRVGQLLQSLGGWITGTALPFLGQKLVQWGRAFVEWIGPMIPPALAAIGNAAGRLFGWLIDTGLPRLLANLRRWGTAFVEWIAPMVPPALAALGGVLASLVGWLVSVGLPKLVGALARLGVALVEWIAPMIPKAVAAIASLVGRLVSWAASEGLSMLLSAGSRLGGALGDGLVSGIRGLAGQVAAAARAVADSAVAAIKSALSIASPSKVTIELGEFFSKGMAIGIKSGSAVALQATTEMMAQVKDKLIALKTMRQQLVSGARSAVTGALDVGGLGARGTAGDRPGAGDIASASISLERAKRRQADLQAPLEGDATRSSDYDLDLQDAALAVQSAQRSLEELKARAAEPDPTALRVTEQLRTFSQEAGQFAGALRTAAEKGLDPSLITKIAALGPTNGLTSAQAIAALNRAEVSQANSSIALADKFAANVAATVLTTTSLPADIARQQGVLNTLQEIRADLAAHREIKINVYDATDPDKVVASIRNYVRRNGLLRNVSK